MLEINCQRSSQNNGSSNVANQGETTRCLGGLVPICNTFQKCYCKSGSDFSDGSRISPRWGRQLSGGRQRTMFLNFPKNYMKLKEFGPPGGRASLMPYLDPPLDFDVASTWGTTVCLFSLNETEIQ